MYHFANFITDLTTWLGMLAIFNIIDSKLIAIKFVYFALQCNCISIAVIHAERFVYFINIVALSICACIQRVSGETRK